MADSAIARSLESACEALLLSAANADEVTVRSITARVGTNVAAINYHFGGLEKLIFSVGQKAYLRLNAERLSMLNRAVERARPRPAPAEALIEALIGPSIRWSLDPGSLYKVLKHMTTIAQASQHPEIFRSMIEDIDHHRMFVPHFRLVAPWLSDADIGFRMSCLLGVRSQMIRQRSRTETLTNHALDLSDPEIVITHIVAATTPMFTTPPAAHSNSVSIPSRH